MQDSKKNVLNQSNAIFAIRAISQRFAITAKGISSFFLRAFRRVRTGDHKHTSKTNCQLCHECLVSLANYWNIFSNIWGVFLWVIVFITCLFFFPTLYKYRIDVCSSIYIYFLFLFNLKRGVFIHNPFIVFIAWVG